MSSGLKEKNMKFLLSVDKDVRQAMEAIQGIYDSSLGDGLTHAEIASISGIDPSALSRIVNGKKANITFKTAARIMRAVGQRMTVEGCELTDIPQVAVNSRCHPELSSDWLIMKFVHDLENGVGIAKQTSTKARRSANPLFKLKLEEATDARS
jgi:transcriptional regulator with XRE-family HTH domain